MEENRSKKALHHDKIGKDFILTFDETKRVFVVCAVEKVSQVVEMEYGSYTSCSIRFMFSFSTRSFPLFKAWVCR